MTPIAKVTVANLDADGVYHGLVEKDEADVTDLDVVLANGCDLPAGKYRWDREQNAFLPIKVVLEQGTDPGLDVGAMQALHALIRAQVAAGVTLPAKCTDWADAFGRTLDAQ